jgi:sugar/nucleoside kinase (ribokinase family)
MSILCVGQFVADVVVRPVNALPVPGRTDLVQDLEVVAGGCAANTAAVLAKLGTKVRLAALIGKDPLGDAALADLKQTGVCLDAVLRDQTEPTSAVLVLVTDHGERSFIYRRGGMDVFSNRHLPDVVLKSAKIVHVGGALKLRTLDLEELFTRLKAFGATTSIDTDWDSHGLWMERLQAALPKTDYLFTNDDEAAMLTGKTKPREAAQALLSRGARVVIIKRGERGAMLFSSSETLDLPAYGVDVKDTTCAGDAFVAGFLFGLDRGNSWSEAMRLANAAGALCTTRISHRGVTSLAALQDLIRASELCPGLATPCAYV